MAEGDGVGSSDPSQSQSQSQSPSNSQGSSTNPPPFLSPPPPPKEEEEEDTAMDTVASAQVDDKPDVHDGFQDFTAEEILKYQKYEADYACRLRAKYFSNTDIYGDDIFDLTVTMGNETIKASRWSPTQSYADPKQSFVDHGNVLSSGTETSPIVANGNITPPKKSS